MGIGRYLLALFLEIPFFFGILWLIENESKTRRMRMNFKRLEKLCNREKKIEKSKNLLLEEVGENDVDEDITKLNDFLIENENFFKLTKEKPLIACNLTKNYENFQAVKVSLETRPFKIPALKKF